MKFNRKSISKAIASFSVVLMLLTLIPTGVSAAPTSCDRTASDQTTYDQNNCDSECEQANCDGTCNLPEIQGNYSFDCLQRKGRDQTCLTQD